MKKSILILIPLCCLFSCGEEIAGSLDSKQNSDSEAAEFTPVDSFGIQDKLPENELKVEATGFAKMNEKAIEQTISKFSKNKDLIAIEKSSEERTSFGKIIRDESIEMAENIEKYSLGSYYKSIKARKNDFTNVYYNSESNTYFLETLNEMNKIPYPNVTKDLYQFYDFDSLFICTNTDSNYYFNVFKMLVEGSEFYIFEMIVREEKYPNNDRFLLVVDANRQTQRIITQYNTYINDYATDAQLTEDVKEDNEILVAGATTSSQEINVAIQSAINDLDKITQADFKEFKPYKHYDINYILFNDEGYASYDFTKNYDESGNPEYSIIIKDIEYINPFL